MIQADEMVDLKFRPAALADSDLLYQWRNDPLTVAMSRSARAIDPPEHEAWLEGVLGSDRQVLLIATDGDQPVGSVRFDKTAAAEFEISLTTAPESRGQGLGRAMLVAASEYARGHLGAPSLVAEVKEENEASRRIFEDAGYELAGTKAGMRHYRLQG